MTVVKISHAFELRAATVRVLLFLTRSGSAAKARLVPPHVQPASAIIAFSPSRSIGNHERS